MKLFLKTSVFCLSAGLVLAGCSFSYESDTPLSESVPDMTLHTVHIQRFEKGFQQTEAYGNIVEFYNNDDVWVGKGTRFTGYETNAENKRSFSGTAGSFYIDEKNEEFYLGGTVSFMLETDHIHITAPALFWEKRQNRLSAPQDASVEIKKKDELTMRGRGFSANTLTQEFEFTNGLSGTFELEDAQEKDTADEQTE